MLEDLGASLLKTFMVDGYWELPPSHRPVPGTVIFSPEDGISLKLNGSFEDSSDVEPGGTLESIHGFTSKDAKVTLARCHKLRETRHFPGHKVSEYVADWMFLGEHFASFEEARFQSVCVSYHNLAECIGLTGLKEQPWKLSDQPFRHTISYMQPPQLTAELGDFKISTEYGLSVDPDPFERIEIAQRPWLRVTAPTETHLDDFLQGPFRSLHSLLELAADSRLPIVAVQGTSKRTQPLSTKILFQQFYSPRIPRRRHVHQLLFTLTHLGPRWAACLNSWHDARDRCGPTFDLYFSLNRTVGIALEHQLLFLVQALESYHRRTHDDYELPLEAFDELVRRMINAVDPERHEWLRERIKHINELSLRKRLRKLYEQLPQPVRRALGPRAQFINAVVDTRNYMTHFEQRLKNRVLTGAELLQAVEKLKVMLRTIFLLEMGLGEDEVVSIISGSRLLERISAIKTEPKETSTGEKQAAIMQFFGRLPIEEADAMARRIEESCERLDRDW